MSSIQFSVDLDTTKLEASIKQSNQTVGDWAKGVEQAGNSADKSFQKAGDSMREFASLSKSEMKESITIQKQAIKELEQELTKLEQIQSKANGKNLSNANLAVGGKKNEIASEKEMLVKMQNEQVLANEAEVASQGGLVSSLGKWAAGLMTVAAAMKVGKAIIESTETTAHAFEQVTTAAASATGVLFKAIATGDWSNFQQGMDRAVQGALDYVDAMEKLNNLQNEQKIRSSKYDIAIGKARADSFSADPEVVKKALTELVRLQKLKLTEEAGLVKQRYDLDLKKVADDNNINSKQLQQKIEYYSQYRDIIEKGEAYNIAVSNNEAAIRGRNDYGGEKRYQENKKALDELATELGSNANAYAKIATDFNKVPIPNRDALADQLAKSNTARAAIDINNRRDKQRLVGIEKSEQDARDAESKRIQDEKNKRSLEQVNYDTKIGRQRIDNQIALEQGLLDTQKDGAEKQRAQADLDYRKTLNDIAKQKADQLKEYNELNGGIDKKTGKKTSKYIAQLPGEDQAQLDQQAVIAKQKQANDLVVIEEKEAEKIRVIIDQLHDYRLTGIEKEKEAVKDKYDKEEKLAMDAMRFDLVASVAELRGKANAEIDRKYALQEIDYKEQIDSLNAQLSIKNETKLQKALFDIWKKSQLDKAAELEKGTPEEKKQAEVIKKGVDVETKKVDLKDWKDEVQYILGAANDLTAVLLKNNKLTQGEADWMNAGLSIAGKLISQDYLGAAITLIGGIMSSMPNEAQQFADKIEKINQLLKEQQRLIDLSSRSGGEAEARQKELETLRLKQAENQKELDKFLSAPKEIQNRSKKRIEELTQAVSDGKAAIEDAQQALDDLLTGGITQNSIADIIAQGFREGKTSVDDFATYMNDALLNAVTDIFKAEILGPQITDLGLYIKEALSDDVLTQAEKDEITRRTKLIADGKTPLWNDLTGALNLGNTLGSAQSSTLTGSIQRTLTEQTGGELAGLLRKSSDDGRQVRDYSKMAVDHLIGIEKNTLDTVTELKNCVLLLTESNANTAKTAKNTGPVSLRGF